MLPSVASKPDPKSVKSATKVKKMLATPFFRKQNIKANRQIISQFG